MLPRNLYGDKLRLQQVLINLVKNALKFTKDGNIEIVATYDKQTEMLKVHIIDDGKGITDDEMTELFNMFGKLKRTASLNNNGIGMGLMICK